MSKSSIFARGVVAAAAGALALGAAAAAQAQPASSYAGYDPCQREANGRGVGGALIGGGMGAVLGSQVAASGHRSDGSLLGGAIGAIAGAVIGNKSAACGTVPPPPPPPPPADYRAAPPPMAEAPPPPPPGYYEGRFDGPPMAYGPRGQRFRIAERPPSADGCTLAESPIYMPDGRVQKRFVRVCPDANGRYQVVD